jgi:hypothetical protein
MSRFFSGVSSLSVIVQGLRQVLICLSCPSLRIFPCSCVLLALAHVLQGRACSRTEDVVATLASTVLRILSHIQVLARRAHMF